MPYELKYKMIIALTSNITKALGVCIFILVESSSHMHLSCGTCIVTITYFHPIPFLRTTYQLLETEIAVTSLIVLRSPQYIYSELLILNVLIPTNCNFNLLEYIQKKMLQLDSPLVLKTIYNTLYNLIVTIKFFKKKKL